MTELKLWKFSEDYGRCGNAEGLFIATEEEVNRFLRDKDIDFGEILGKHSEVSVCFDSEHLKCLDIGESAVKELFLAVGNRIICGSDPFYHVYSYLKCSDCGFGDFIDYWWNSDLLTDNISCPSCSSKNYKTEEEGE